MQKHGGFIKAEKASPVCVFKAILNDRQARKGFGARNIKQTQPFSLIQLCADDALVSQTCLLVYLHFIGV